MDWNPLSWFSLPAKWISSAAGSIGSGIEAGFIAMLKDVWNVVGGTIEIAAGVLVFMFAIGVLFRNDMLSLAPLLLR